MTPPRFLNSINRIILFQGKGVMPDGTTRLSKDGKDIYHFMGCSTFAEYAVISEISAAKVDPGADLYQVKQLVKNFLILFYA